jgi:DNA-binding XRE family transcriptional regulator
MTNGEKLKMLRKCLGLTQPEAAQFFTDTTVRPCATRTIAAWEATDDLSSARVCPDWAVELLTRKAIASEAVLGICEHLLSAAQKAKAQ